MGYTDAMSVIQDESCGIGYHPLPKCYALSTIRRKHALGCLREAVAASPVLVFLDIEVRPGHGRFWFVRDGERVARVTPAGRVRRSLEVPEGKGWSVMSLGASEREVVQALATNDLGFVHYLGSLEQALKAEVLERGREARIVERVDDDFVVDFLPSVRGEAAERCVFTWDDGWRVRS